MSEIEKSAHFLGIDIGSVYLHYAVINQDGQLVRYANVPHFGNIRATLQEKLRHIDFTKIRYIVFNNRADEFFTAGQPVNEQIALVEGILHLYSQVGSLFVIGGETFGLILFDQNKHYQKYIGNSSCAAGTGAFLDQQAERLGLAGSTELGKLAEKYQREPPKIATRCAVFAKTDLVHCQQQGKTVEAIAAGLCQGLAYNIADTLLKGVTLNKPVIAVGGVSKNRKVIRYLSEIIGYPILVPKNPEMVIATGCAILARNQNKHNNISFKLNSLLVTQNIKKQYFFDPLKPKNGHYPRISTQQSYVSNGVEVDLYQPLKKQNTIPVFMGIDIGSTSTKTMLMSAQNDRREILIGLYTRTMGQPIKATQTLFSALNEIAQNNHIQFEFYGVGTTGSGRKFIEKIINADLALDEITAHAMAAYALNPKVDTIIEIGGQDSKFTVLKDGQVTFSVMNYVCAAGTGSFIEEQAKRLNIPLEEYAEKAMNKPAPLTSDRCTVFMERDLNYLLSRGYSKEELLAAALHSVRDNYLSKVAHRGKMGRTICFQGATAKNRALVIAFEQKLQKSIFVSKYCHLTGAMGVCLYLQQQNLSSSSFRGINFFKETVKVEEQICNDCKNHCKLNKIQIGGETILWGHLCGREEGKPKTAQPDTGFDLLSRRRKVFLAIPFPEHQSKAKYTSDHKKFDFDSAINRLKKIDFSHSWQKIKRIDLDNTVEKLKKNIGLNLLQLQHKYYAFTRDELRPEKERNKITIGIPNALYLQEYFPFWRFFFHYLGYSVLVSPQGSDLLKKGKTFTGSEFCAPICAWYGHVHHLSTRVDYLFLPHMLSNNPKNLDRFYCYYSNYAVSLVQNSESLHIEGRIISPVINFSESVIEIVRQIYDSMPAELSLIQTPNKIHEAFTQAWQWYSNRKHKLIELFEHRNYPVSDISVVLMGRPYIIFDPGMNKNIPKKFNDQNIPTFFQDMLPPIHGSSNKIGKAYLSWNHWRYGSDILNAAEYTGQTRGLYPVYLTGFKCSPDAFVLDYFKDIMDSYQKPYLILQIDEHDSEAGYDTRIEASIRTFRTHFRENKSIQPMKKTIIINRSFPKDGNVLIPNYDGLSCSLICAAFEREGYKAILIEESPTTIQSSLRLNDGQCLPISAIVQGAIETVRKHRLPAEKTAIFLNAITKLSCNLPQYPLMALQLLKKEGGAFEKMHVFATEFELRGLSYDLVYNYYFAYLLGGLLRRIACKIRPYERDQGETDRLLERSRQVLVHCFRSGRSKEEHFKKIVDAFAQIPVDISSPPKPKVAIVGDLYVRDNDIFNQRLIHELEQLGAEVITTPFNYILRLLVAKHRYTMLKEGRYLSLLRDKLLIEVFEQFEKRFYNISTKILDETFPTFDDEILAILKEYNITLRHDGETAQNIMKIYSMLHHYPNISLFIHVNPIFCCPGLVSESIFKRVEKKISIPIISITYDGTMHNKNELLAPYLFYIQQSLQAQHDEKQTTLKYGVI
ncbi:CoA activase [bacterium]|nr:CoA activase [bacterium]